MIVKEITATLSLKEWEATLPFAEAVDEPPFAEEVKIPDVPPVRWSGPVMTSVYTSLGVTQVSVPGNYTTVANYTVSGPTMSRRCG